MASKDETKSKAPHEKPLSLHPLSVEDALRKAMQSDPKKRDEKKGKKK